MTFLNSLGFCFLKTTIILTLIIWISCEGERRLIVRERSRRPANECSRNYNIDFILLSLQWPTSFCWDNKACNKQIDPNQWQIHGLWPQRRSGEWPQFCCSDNSYNTRNIESLKDQLLRKWKTLRADGKHEPFWRHEWTKHGSCAHSLPQLNGQFNYFNTTLHLYDSFPLTSWLSKRGISASNEKQYSLNSIHESIEYELKRRVRLECAPFPNSAPLLTEIHICLNKTSLKAIDCQHRDDRQCGRNTVLFPRH